MSPSGSGSAGRRSYGTSTGIVLAGGLSVRMGRPKALVEVDGEPMIVRAASRLRELCDEVLVVGGDPDWATLAGATFFADPGTGPPGGLAAGLRAARHDVCVLLACDMPWADARVLAWMVGALGDHDACVPVDVRPQPLHAVYRRRCERRDAPSMMRLLDELRVRYVGRDEWSALDPDGRSWRDVDTPGDLGR